MLLGAEEQAEAPRMVVPRDNGGTEQRMRGRMTGPELVTQSAKTLEENKTTSDSLLLFHNISAQRLDNKGKGG